MERDGERTKPRERDAERDALVHKFGYFDVNVELFPIKLHIVNSRRLKCVVELLLHPRLADSRLEERWTVIDKEREI